VPLLSLCFSSILKSSFSFVFFFSFEVLIFFFFLPSHSSFHVCYFKPLLCYSFPVASCNLFPILLPFFFSCPFSLYSYLSFRYTLPFSTTFFITNSSNHIGWIAFVTASVEGQPWLTLFKDCDIKSTRYLVLRLKSEPMNF
jgi:hypothetical protein